MIITISPFYFQLHYDVSILLTIILVIFTIVLIFVFRYKCKSNRTWVSDGPCRFCGDPVFFFFLIFS